MNSFGKIYRLTEFGESHGTAIGGIIDGVPAGITLDIAHIQRKLDQRRPGYNPLTSPRKEPDSVEFLSGIKDGVTLGTPIGFIIRNHDAHSEDYAALQHVYRPNHADYTYEQRYGIRDHRGGGRASARSTASRIVAGAIALQILAQQGIQIRAFISQIGPAIMPHPYASFPDEDTIYASDVRCPDAKVAEEMASIVRSCIGKDSVGGRVSAIIRGVRAGIGNPVYEKVQGVLAAAMMSINAAHGFEYGDGFRLAGAYGTEVLDRFIPDGNGGVTTDANHSGGIQGGITNGNDITFSVAFKPTPTLPIDVVSCDDKGQPTTITARGRHDPCVAIRAVSVVEAMAAISILDCILSS
jgi:chorismate synthase